MEERISRKVGIQGVFIIPILLVIAIAPWISACAPALRSGWGANPALLPRPGIIARLKAAFNEGRAAVQWRGGWGAGGGPLRKPVTPLGANGLGWSPPKVDYGVPLAPPIAYGVPHPPVHPGTDKAFIVHDPPIVHYDIGPDPGIYHHDFHELI